MEKREVKPRECGATTGAARPPEWPISPLEWGVRRGSARPPEWQKTPGGSRNGVEGGVELPQGSDTPGVAEVPQGGKTPGGPTAAEVRPRKDGRGHGQGDENPPTA